MAEQIPTYLVGTGSTFTAVGQLGPNDTLAGVVNHADLVPNSIIFKNSASEVDALPLTQNTLVGNIGSGVAAVSAAELLALVFDQFSGAKGELLVHNGTDWVTLAPGTNGQILSANSETATGLEFTSTSSFLGGATTLDALTDTVITSPADGQFLKYDSGSWVNSAVETADLSWIDITTTPIQTNEGIKWDGTKFVPTVLGGSADDLGNHTASQSLVMTTHDIVFTTGTIDFSTTMDIGSASWSLTEAAGAFTISTVSGGTASRFSIASNGNITLPSYPDSRHDASTVAPENFLYTDGSGNLLSADIDGGDLATWANIQLSDLVDVLYSASITDGHVLTWDQTAGEWQAKASTVEDQALTFVASSQTLQLGKGYVITNGSYTLTLPQVGLDDNGKQVRLILKGGDWQSCTVNIVVNSGNALATIFDGQTTPFLANSSTLYLTWDDTSDNWIGSV